MNINIMKKAKFNLFDTVYFIDNNKIESGIILKIKCAYVLKAAARCEYIPKVPENKIFGFQIQKEIPDDVIINSLSSTTLSDSSISYTVYKGTLKQLNNALIKSSGIKSTIKNLPENYSSYLSLIELIDNYHFEKNIKSYDESKLYYDKSEICKCSDN